MKLALLMNKILTILKIKKDSIPKQFEYIETQYWFKDRPEVPIWVTVFGSFVHHYSNETFYRIRIEKMGFLNVPYTEYRIVDEKELRTMMETRTK
jgi:hypothetical protein